MRRVVGFQKNTAHPEMTHQLASAKTLKSRIWRRAALSSVAHAPTTITTDFAWCGMLAVLPWWPRTVTFGKVEIKVKKLERTGSNFFRSTSFQIFGNYLEERLPTGPNSLEIWNKIGNIPVV